jgi:hypothetical protein
MQLYSVTKEYLSVFEKLNEIEGLDQETINNTLSPLQQDIKTKSINVAAWLKNIEAEIEAIDVYMKNMQEKKKSRAKKIEWLKNYLRENMLASGIEKIECPEFQISLGSEDIRTEIIDQGVLPVRFCRRVEKLEPDKTLIKESILNGEDVDGAMLVRTRRLTIK